MFYTVPWLPDLGDREVPRKALELTRMAALCCRQPMPYRARVTLFFLTTGLKYELCSYAVWMALELGMLEWCDDSSWVPT